MPVFENGTPLESSSNWKWCMEKKMYGLKNGMAAPDYYKDCNPRVAYILAWFTAQWN